MVKNNKAKKGISPQIVAAFISAFIAGAASILVALIGLLKTNTPASNTIINNILPDKYAAMQRCEKQNQASGTATINLNDNSESANGAVEPGAILINKSKNTSSSSVVLKGKLLPNGQAEGDISVKGAHTCTEPALAILDENGVFMEVALLPKVCTEPALTGQTTPERTVSWETQFTPASMKHYSLYRVKWDGSFETGLISKEPHIQNALNARFH